MDNIRTFKFYFEDEEKLITCDEYESIESLLSKYLLESNCPKTLDNVNLDFVYNTIILNSDKCKKKRIKDVFKGKKCTQLIIVIERLSVVG